MAHAIGVPASSWQVTNEVASLTLKASVAVLPITWPAAGELIVTTGGVPSTVYVAHAGVGSVTPLLIARTQNLCEPSACVGVVKGEVQAA